MKDLEIGQTVTAKKCSKCGELRKLSEFTTDKRNKDGRVAKCKKCINNRYIIDVTKILEYQKNYRRNNKVKITTRDKKYREENKVKIDKRRKEYREENKVKIAKKTREWVENNKDKAKEKTREWAKNNKAKVRLIRKKYRSSEKGRVSSANSYNKSRYLRKCRSDGTIPLFPEYPLSKELHILLNTQGGKCAYCECEINHKLGNIHLDHIQPISKNGNHSIRNVQWLCNICNISKGTRYVGIDITKHD